MNKYKTKIFTYVSSDSSTYFQLTIVLTFNKHLINNEHLGGICTHIWSASLHA